MPHQSYKRINQDRIVPLHTLDTWIYVEMYGAAYYVGRGGWMLSLFLNAKKISARLKPFTLQLRNGLLDMPTLPRVHTYWIRNTGQATVEYTVVLLAFMAILLGLAAVFHAMSDGRFLSHVITALPFTFGGSQSLGVWQDVLLF